MPSPPSRNKLAPAVKITQKQISKFSDPVQFCFIYLLVFRIFYPRFSGLEINFLEPSSKMSYGIALTVGRDQSLF